MRWPTFDKYDFLATKVMLGLAALLTTFAATILPVATWLRGDPLKWQLSTIPSTASVTGMEPAQGVSISIGAGVQAKIADASTSAWLASLAPGLISTVSVLLMVGLLVRLLQRIQTGSPFVAQSVRALRMIGVTIFVGSSLSALATGVAESVVSSEALRGAFGFSFEAPIALLLGALLVLALAEAFAQGIRLAADVEGLV